MATLICTRTTCLRSLTTANRAFSPASSLTAAFSTSTARHTKQPRLNANASRPAIAAKLPPKPFAVTSVRHASTPSSIASETTSEDILSWDRFFELRKKRRWINLGCSVVTAFITVGAVTPVLVNNDIDSWGAQISGLDPVIVLGVTTFATAGAGWLCGPSFGNLVFGMWAARRGWNKLIAEKEKSFYARIKRYRVDPSGSSPQNPAPDYYGEKISSVKDYRRWLKDQRAFNLKKNKNLV